MRIIILFVFVLSTLDSVSFAQSEHPCIICHYGGALSRDPKSNSFTFSIDKVPDRCEIISYGATYFNSQPAKEDANAITQLKKAGRIVYMFYMYPDDVDWAAIISSTDSTDLDNLTAPMLTYVNENKIDGVILGYLGLFKGKIPNYTTKIRKFLSKIKECAPNLKISFFIDTSDPLDFGYKYLFDFTVVNDLVDIFLIDTALNNLCNSTTIAANGGRLPITTSGTDDSRLTLEQYSTNVTDSGMDANKLYVTLNSAVTKMIPNNDVDILPYSKYCVGPISKTDVYCVDTMQQFYDAAQYSKKYFKGILIYGVDFDDYDNSCCCGLFPVTNTYVDGWTDQPLKSCDKIG